jgi:Tol biopolymer transport system component
MATAVSSAGEATTSPSTTSSRSPTPPEAGGTRRRATDALPALQLAQGRATLRLVNAKGLRAVPASVSCLALVLASAASSSVTSAARAPGTERLVFSSGVGVYSIRPDGRARRLLRRNGYSPAWSPDRRRVAFIRGTNEIWTMRSDGGGARRVTFIAGPVHHAVWSPDGRRLVFDALDVSRESFGGRDMHVVPASGRRYGFNPLFVSNDAHEFPTDWYRNGDLIAYNRFPPLDDQGGGRAAEVWVYSFRSRSSRRLLRNARDARWSPDGRLIAFVRGGRIWVGADNGARSRPITRRRREVSSPAWSPDGSRIAFIEAGRIVIVDRSGARRRYLSNPRVYDLDW